VPPAADVGARAAAGAALPTSSSHQGDLVLEDFEAWLLSGSKKQMCNSELVAWWNALAKLYLDLEDINAPAITRELCEQSGVVIVSELRLKTAVSEFCKSRKAMCGSQKGGEPTLA
ncbi:hypothetical protein JCM10449v2_007115, partial [Rhodotorula kratochvilovae]